MHYIFHNQGERGRLMTFLRDTVGVYERVGYIYQTSQYPPPKEEIVGGMVKYTYVGPKRPTTSPCSMLNKVLMALE